MTDQNHPNLEPDEQPDDALFDDVPVEEDASDEPAPPRRAASAEFIVDTEVGSEAALRAAMDPANQSLAEALRLSFRLLQLVIVVLVGLFFISGFQTIDEGESGIMLRWGKIVPKDGQESLDPGLHFTIWPYPVGDFEVFPVENLSVTLGDEYWPLIPPGSTIEDATQGASVRDPLRLDVERRTGYVITRDGDLAHVRVNAQYQIEAPAELAQRIPVDKAEQFVRLALRRAVVHTAASTGLQDVVDGSEAFRHQIELNAQEILDAMRSGVRVTSLTLPDATVPLAIRRTFGDLQNARVEAEQHIEQARLDANQRLIDSAGERHRSVIRLISQYEDRLQSGDEDAAAQILAEINRRFDTGELSGEVARVIEMARAYRSQIEASLGNEARRFSSLLPAFRDHPDLVIRQRWLDAYARVLNRRDAEVFFVPHDIGHVRLDLARMHAINEIRQKMALDRREREAIDDFYSQMRGPYLQYARDVRLSGPGRQLRVDEEGRARGLGER